MLRYRQLLAVALFVGTVNAEADAPRDTPTVSDGIGRLELVGNAAGLSGQVAMSERRFAGIVFTVWGPDAKSMTSRQHVDRRWLWGSLTKQVTAILIMQDVQAGRIELDGVITRYLPDFTGATGDTITVRQLLQHHSGLPNPDDTIVDADGVPAFYRETGAAIGNTARARGYCSRTPKAMPGARFEYNNCDYLVLGAILEAVNEAPYEALVRERISAHLVRGWIPLARDGEANGGPDVIGNRRPGVPYPPINVATYGAAGALTGSHGTILQMDRQLMAGKLGLSRKSVAIMTTGDPRLGYQALGVWSYPARLRGCLTPVDIIERRGDVAGIQSRNIIAPKIGRYLVMFVDDASVDFGEVWQERGLGYELLSAAFCPPESDERETNLDPAATH